MADLIPPNRLTFLPTREITPETRMRGLAREMARDLLPREVIFKAYDITDEDWDFLSTSPAFRGMLEHELQTWNSELSASERIELKTKMILEYALDNMAEYLVDPKFSDNAKVELFKALQKGAGVGLNGKGVEEGGKVSITINMGDDRQLKVEHERPMIDVTPQES